MVATTRNVFQPWNWKQQQQEQDKKEPTAEPNDRLIDLTGVWEGDYGRNGIEIVEIEYAQNHFVANKM